MKTCKQKSGHAYKQNRHRRLWQPSYFDRVLRDEATDLFVIRYILENPVRAGLVERCEDYPYLGCSLMSIPEMLKVLQDVAEPWRP